MNINKRFLTLVLIALAFKINAQQAVLNLVAETITGQSDTVPMAPIMKVGSNYIVSANQKVNPTRNDFKTTSLNGNIESL